jgi:predicted TIM-barrel fold metal-dependent hydrolase
MMDIVDAQVHLGPGGAPEMVAAMDAIGIRAAMIDEWWVGTPGHPGYALANGAYRPVTPTTELAAWTYPGRFSYLLRVDHRDPELASLARQARDATHCRALRILAGNTRAEMAQFEAGDHGPVFRAAADNGLPLFVMAAGLAETVARYAREYPATKIILDHTGMPFGKLLRPILAQLEGLPDSAAWWAAFGDGPADLWFDKVLRLADYPNVALKWGHAPSMFDEPGYPNAGLRPWLRKAIDGFGVDRVMWASDQSVNQTGESWAELLFMIRNDPGLSDAEKAAVLGGTVRKWLDWPK